MTSNHNQKGKTKGWLKGILSNRNDSEEKEYTYEEEQSPANNDDMEALSNMNELRTAFRRL